MTGSGRKNAVEFDPLLAVLHSNGHLFNTLLSLWNWQNKKRLKRIFLPSRNKQDLVIHVIWRQISVSVLSLDSKNCFMCKYVGRFTNLKKKKKVRHHDSMGAIVFTGSSTAELCLWSLHTISKIREVKKHESSTLFNVS